MFLSSFGFTAGLALFLFAVSLEPSSNMTRSQGGQFNLNELLNDARLSDWIAIGGVGVIVAGLILGIDSLDAPSNGFWFLLQDWGVYLGLGSMVLIASRGQIAGYRLGGAPLPALCADRGARRHVYRWGQVRYGREFGPGLGLHKRGHRVPCVHSAGLRHVRGVAASFGSSHLSAASGACLAYVT